jgi:hypothetical protein
MNSFLILFINRSTNETVYDCVVELPVNTMFASEIASDKAYEEFNHKKKYCPSLKKKLQGCSTIKMEITQL